MATDDAQIPGGVDREIGDVVSAVRWTLGNLDEAFRACLNSIEIASEGDRDGADACGALDGHGDPAAAGRFCSCEGPITDGEPGEGLGPGSAALAPA
jgi:hypothetical protein